MSTIQHLLGSLSDFVKSIRRSGNTLEDDMIMRVAVDVQMFQEYLADVVNVGILDAVPMYRDRTHAMAIRLSPRPENMGNGCVVFFNESTGMTLSTSESLMTMSFFCFRILGDLVRDAPDQVHRFARDLSRTSYGLEAHKIESFLQDIVAVGEEEYEKYNAAQHWNTLRKYVDDPVIDVLYHVWSRENEQIPVISEPNKHHWLYTKILNSIQVADAYTIPKISTMFDTAKDLLRRFDYYDAEFLHERKTFTHIHTRGNAIFRALDALALHLDEFSPHWQAVIRQMREQTDYYTGEAHYELALSLRETNPLDAFQYFCVASASWSRVHKQLNRDIFKEVVALSEANGWQELRNYYRWVEEAL